MDDTQSSKVSDAGAKRKRRSSILKSQRTSRAPLSELEFNVATPTDTTKSRRVSFSRRTGVAEFVTHESTTTWKNFYEEHNKTLESSGNETDVHAARPSVGHLGKGLFYDQFQEVEAIDFDTTHVETSITNVKIDNAAIEGVTVEKIAVPQQNFEFSAFTEQSNVFKDDLAVFGYGEVSDKIPANFSELQLIGDNFDEMQKDLKASFVRTQSNMSEYLEVDFNTTHVALKDDQSDMSITDTIHSPKVNVSKSISGQMDKSVKDWVVDKENIVLNPYVAPKETTNFAINEEPDKVLVFDGKRLTVQSEKDPITDYRKTLLPNSVPERRSFKPIVLNTDDDLPNFIENPTSVSFRERTASNKTLVGSDDDLSMTEALPGVMEACIKQKAVVYEDGNISLTLAVPTNILQETNKRKTIVFDDDAGNISITQAIPKNIIISEQKADSDKTNVPGSQLPESKNVSYVFATDIGDMSVTQALPANILAAKRMSVVYGANVSVTQVVPSNADMSVTQVLPANILAAKRKSVVYDFANVSVTQAVPSNLILPSKDGERRQTINYEGESADVSMTEVISNVIKSESYITAESDRKKALVFDSDVADMSVTKALPNNVILHEEYKKHTIVNETDIDTDISMTETVPVYIMAEARRLSEAMSAVKLPKEIDESSVTSSSTTVTEVPKTESDEADMSVTESEEIIENTESKQIKVCKESFIENLINRNESVLKSATKPTPGDLLSLQKDLIDKYNINNINAEVLVYQTSTLAAKFRKEYLPASAVTSTDTSQTDMEFQEDPTKDEETTTSVAVATRTDSDQKSKLEQSSESLKNEDSNVNYGYVDTSATVKLENKPQKSILDDLLDMHDEEPEGTEVKCVSAQLSEQSSIKLLKVENKGSSESSMFYIRDSTDEKSEEEYNNKKAIENVSQFNPVDPLQNKYLNSIEDLEKKIVELQRNSPNRSPIKNRHIEKIVSSDVNEYRRKSNLNNNTQDLLEMLSKFTDKEEAENPLKPECVISKEVPRRQSVVLSREDIMNNISMAQAALQTCDADFDSDNGATPEKSASPKKSVRLSAEVVKTLRFEDDETTEVSTKFDLTPLKKTVFGETSYMDDERKRMDKSRVIPEYLTDITDLKELMEDLVKPSADVLPFDTTSVGREVKPAPSVTSTHIQANLVTSSQVDLDPEPIDWSSPGAIISSGMRKLKGIMKSPSINPSEEPGTVSERSSDVDFSENKNQDAYERYYKEVGRYQDNASIHSRDVERQAVDQSIPGRTIVFDLTNPLNNVLIAPIDMEEAHRYYPPTPKDSNCDSELRLSPVQVTFKDLDTDTESADRYSTNYAVPVIIPDFQKYSINSSFKDTLNCNTKPVKSVETSVATVAYQKDEESNTLIVMKENKKLLETSSSLTLVDDSVRNDNYDDDNIMSTESDFGNKEKSPFYGVLDSGTSKDVSPVTSASPIEVMYENSKKIDSYNSNSDRLSEMTSEERFSDNNKKRKPGDKHKSCLTALDVSPAPPVSKMVKHSTSPYQMTTDYNLKKNSYRNDSSPKNSANSSPSPSKKSPKSKRKSSPKLQKPGTNITVQQLMTEFSVANIEYADCERIDENVLESSHSSTSKNNALENVLESSHFSTSKNNALENVLKSSHSSTSKNNALENVLESSHSSTSKNNALENVLESSQSSINELENVIESQSSTSKSNELESSGSSKPSEKGLMCYQPELNLQPSSNIVIETEDAVDMVSKIDKLHFMGSNECSWECVNESGWSFLLLLGRLRLRVGLAGGGGRYVSPRAPLAHLTIELTHLHVYTTNKKKATAELCIRFALEAMRYFIGRGCSTAGEVPALLRQCAAVARVALRWSRAMHEAWLHLAYTLTSDGLFTLKVANFPLRSVWEVTMTIEMVVSDAREVPWPRATNVKVSAVVSDIKITPEDVRRAIGHVDCNWGHVPRTIWRIFKYLKHKTQDDDLLLRI